jgi:hypothetical protein
MLQTADDTIVFDSSPSIVNVFCSPQIEETKEAFPNMIEIMEIPAYCVEYIGEILTRTDHTNAPITPLFFDDKPSLSNTRTPALLRSSGVLANLEMSDIQKTSIPKSSSDGLSSNGYEDNKLYKIQVHICECISVIMCCTFRFAT